MGAEGLLVSDVTGPGRAAGLTSRDWYMVSSTIQFPSPAIGWALELDQRSFKHRLLRRRTPF